MRYLLYLFIFVCWSCKEEIPWRIEGLYSHLEHRALTSVQIDSMIDLAKKLTPLEHYVYVCKVQAFCSINRPELVEYYRKKLRELPFPVVKNKESGLLLMERFAYGGLSPQDVDMEMLSKLLFDMENRFRFTPEEKCRYLTLKSGIYAHFFREYEVAASIAGEAGGVARESGFPGERLYDIYVMQYRCYMYLEDREKLIELTHEFLSSNDDGGIDADVRQKIYLLLSTLHYQQKEYDQAYFYWKKSEKSDSLYSEVFAEILLESNHVSEAWDYLEEQRKLNSLRFRENTRALHVNLGKIAWSQASICLRQGDTAGYDRYLGEAVRYYDREPGTWGGAALSEAYVRWLWTHGKRPEAFARMEALARNLSEIHSVWEVPERIKGLQMVTDYYVEAGRFADVCRQLKLCDSLKEEWKAAWQKEEKRKLSNRVYMEDLRRNLDRQTLNFQQERQRMLLVAVLFGCAVVLSVVFGRLYFRRQKELNAIYAIQKKNERMESAFLEIETVENLDDLPADKQLYLRLQKQMHEQKLFLKPDFSRNDLCRLAGSNRMYVSTSINKYSEMNLNQWINKARINHAIGLIHSGEVRLQVLAESSGFSSSSAFYRNFKYFTLMTPKQYIERERKSVSSGKKEMTESQEASDPDDSFEEDGKC